MEPLKIFYSYAHKDKTLREELGKHLSNCRSQKICQDWFDGDIVPGEEWDKEIKTRLQMADFILLLISADFLNSPYIASVEMDEAMRRHQAFSAQVVPIMLRHCDFSGSVFSKIQGLPTDMKPVTSWPDQDEAWTVVVRGLKNAFEKFRVASNGTGSSGVPPTSSLPDGGPAEPKGVDGSADGLSIAQEENRTLAAASTEGIEGLSEMEGPKIKAIVAKQQEALIAANDALQVLVDYKNVHDRLHDLQFKCYNYIFQEGRKLEEEIDWPLLVQPQKHLDEILRSLQQAAAQPSMADEDFAWLKPLQTAKDRLDAACDDFTIEPLQEAVAMIRTILEMRPTIFDTKLCAAAKTLPLRDLRTALSTIRDEIGGILIASDAGKRFTAGVDALPELSNNLQRLTTEHARWQVIASTLWSIDALIDQNIDVLLNRWPNLHQRLETICRDNSEKWALSILESAAKLDQLLGLPASQDPLELQRWHKRIRMAYTSCSNDGGTRFYQVDLSLKRLCDELQEVQLALAKII